MREKQLMYKFIVIFFSAEKKKKKMHFIWVSMYLARKY